MTKLAQNENNVWVLNLIDAEIFDEGAAIKYLQNFHEPLNTRLTRSLRVERMSQEGETGSYNREIAAPGMRSPGHPPGGFYPPL